MLCQEITRATGIPACTSVLALNEGLTRIGARRLALVTPYRSDVQERIIATYARSGIDIVAERHFGIQDNFSFSMVTEAAIAAAVRDVAAASPDAIAVFCTNLRGATVAPALERELGLPIFDTVATAVWKALAYCDRSPALLADWGRLFSIPSLPARDLGASAGPGQSPAY